MTILFYTPFDQRSRDVESVMLALVRQRDRVLSLSQSSGAGIHPYVNARGVETFSYQPSGSKGGLLHFAKHVAYLVRFCKREKVDVVYSHLESANFVAVTAQFFIRSLVYVNRHHIDEAALRGFDKSIFYRLTYRLAKKVIVVSERARQYMIDVEKVDKDKIVKLPLAYDFSLYPPPDPVALQKIKTSIGAEVVLITACRLTRYKRPEISLRVLKELVMWGIDARLILLGSGEEEGNLKKMSVELGIADKVVMPGRVPNVMDYLSTGTFLLHPSIMESSCVVVKEAAISGLPVIVCRGVGDFDDYIVHGQNGFAISKDSAVTEAVDVIMRHYKDHAALDRVRRSLMLTVKQLFSIERVLPQYNQLNLGKAPLADRS